MRTVLVVASAALALLLALPTGSEAQTQVSTGAFVNEPPVTGGGVRSLAFGEVTVGTTEDTGVGAEGNARSAKWRFENLVKNSSYTVTFNLPAALTRPGHTLPLRWDLATGYGTWQTFRNVEPPTGVTTGSFNPQAGEFGVTVTTAAGQGNNDRVLEIWLGGILEIPANAIAGLYSTTMTAVLSGAF